MTLVLNGTTGVSAVDGTASTPAFQGNDSNTGIYFPGNDRIGFAEGGVQVGEFDASGNFQFNSGYGSVATAYGCRAWVNFNGSGTIAIRASGNVSSITDNGTGDYTVNFTTAMPDANFSGVAFNMDGGSGYRNYFTIGNGYTTTTFRFIIITPSSVYADPSTLGVAIFR
jgi:hypothetical protein